jgi:uncharacterized protein
MIRHLTKNDYRVMPWANGKGTTVEMFRVDENGALKWRLSRATVAEDGDFSILPGVERNLTVLSGPGFDLQGATLQLSAKPLIPIAFSGDIALRATGVTAPSDDFNVMTAASRPRPEVWVHNGESGLANGALTAVYALSPCRADTITLAPGDLILTDQAIHLSGHALVVRLH